MLTLWVPKDNPGFTGGSDGKGNLPAMGYPGFKA